MKKIITLFSLVLCMFATAQENVEYMYIHRNNNVVDSIAVTEIDSVTFAIPNAVLPDVPEAPSQAYEAVDLGLPSGIKWATCNVGATAPEEYGCYYAWGETTEKSNYEWSTYVHCNGSNSTITKYCNRSDFGTVDENAVLALEDDAAHVNWGGSWRMPTKEEQDELRDNCTWEWTSVNGVNGYVVTGNNGNSIFLPAAGYRVGKDIAEKGKNGYYWSSSMFSTLCYNAYALRFYKGTSTWGSRSRNYGQPVRPVSE
mgnify:FL=1